MFNAPLRRRHLHLSGFVVLLLALGANAAVSQGAGPQDALKRGQRLWDQRLAKSAIAALETAAADRATAAEALETLGRIYTFKGWQQEGTFPGWHDEPAYRDRALKTLRAAVAADPARASAQEALRTAEGFAAAESVAPAPPRPEVAALDARIDALRKQPTAPVADLVAAIDARIAAQADPAPYFTGAQLLIDRGEFDRAIALAALGAAASDHFIDENLSAYQMAGKSRGSYARGQATAADLAGWAYFNKKDLAKAAAKLEEAERLNGGLDVVNQFHLGELERARNAPARAREHYVNALSLNGGPAPLRERMRGLAGEGPGLDTELAKRRDERRQAALRSLVDKPLPTLALTTVDGRPFDRNALRNKVVLMDFFASWCGLCKAELPHIKAAFARYQDNPNVMFLLVSVDDDEKRLARYLNEMKFPFPVARLPIETAMQALGFDNVPAAFYVDKEGIVRYQTNGTEQHGDSPSRVGWFIDQLMAKQ
jgi:thiol-disulfide isomerase/thioredoxin